MRKLSPGWTYGVAGLAVFGAAYDSGYFGPTDGHDHSAVVSMAPANSSVTVSNAVLTFANNVTGEAILPAQIPGKPPQTSR